MGHLNQERIALFEDGQRMRCRFQLNTPIEGMTGDGKGECQLKNGRSVDAVIPPGSMEFGKG
jgi:hypothetical protein